MRRPGNALTRHKGVGVFGSALLRRERVRGFGFGIGCSGVIQMTWDGRGQVRVGRIGVGTVTVVTVSQYIRRVRHSRYFRYSRCFRQISKLVDWTCQTSQTF